MRNDYIRYDHGVVFGCFTQRTSTSRLRWLIELLRYTLKPLGNFARRRFTSMRKRIDILTAGKKNRVGK